MFILRILACLWCVEYFGASGEEISNQGGDILCQPLVLLFNQCKVNEVCVVVNTTTGLCKCKIGFEKDIHGSCQPVPSGWSPTAASETSTSSDSSEFGLKLLLWIIIPVLFVGAFGGIIYTGRQKMWLNRLHRMRIQSHNTVLVSSQDEDDPPIA